MSRTDTLEQATSDERPACGVSKQCDDKDFRRRRAAVVSATFRPCRNAECFGDGDPDPDDPVVVAHGRGSDSMHAPRDS